MLNHKKRRIILIISTAIFVLISAAIFMRSQGYVLSNNFTITRTGGLYITAPMANSEIFIDHEKKKTSGIITSYLFNQNLKPGEYSILVAKEGYWPWAKTLTVKEGFVSEAKAFMVPENPIGEILLRGAFSGASASNAQKIIMLSEQKNELTTLSFYLPNENIFLNNDSITTKNLLSPKTISGILWEKNSVTLKTDKDIIKITFNLETRTVNASFSSEQIIETSLYEKIDTKQEQKLSWDQTTNEIFIEWLKKDTRPPYYICAENSCPEKILIFKSKLQIKNIDFFPHRRDIIIASIGNGVYAIEIDGRGGRLLQPIYKGKSPDFTVFGNEDVVYITDEGNLLKIQLK